MGLALFGDNPVYSGTPRPWRHDFFSVADRLRRRFSWATCASSRASGCRPWGPTSHCGGLSYEFWYYLLFPCAWLALFGRGVRWWKRAVYAAALRGGLLFVGPRIALYFPIWLLGTGICLLPRVPLLARWPRGPTAAAVVLLSARWRSPTCAAVRGAIGNSIVVVDYTTGIGFAVLLYLLLHNRASAVNGACSAFALAGGVLVHALRRPHTAAGLLAGGAFSGQAMGGGPLSHRPRRAAGAGGSGVRGGDRTPDGSADGQGPRLDLGPVEATTSSRTGVRAARVPSDRSVNSRSRCDRRRLPACLSLRNGGGMSEIALKTSPTPHSATVSKEDSASCTARTPRTTRSDASATWLGDTHASRKRAGSFQYGLCGQCGRGEALRWGGAHECLCRSSASWSPFTTALNTSGGPWTVPSDRHTSHSRWWLWTMARRTTPPRSSRRTAAGCVRCGRQRGGGSHRNAGIEASDGDLIAFLDQDDWWLREKVERQVALFLAPASLGLVHTGILQYSETAQAVVDGVYDTSGSHLLQGNCYGRLLLGNGVYNSSVMIRRSVLGPAGMFDPAILGNTVQDYDLWLRIAGASRWIRPRAADGTAAARGAGDVEPPGDARR